MNVDFVIKRPKSLSNNTVSKIDVIKHAVLKSEKFSSKNLILYVI